MAYGFCKNIHFAMMHDREHFLFQAASGEWKESSEVHQIHCRRFRPNVGWIFWRKKHEWDQAIK